VLAWTASAVRNAVHSISKPDALRKQMTTAAHGMMGEAGTERLLHTDRKAPVHARNGIGTGLEKRKRRSGFI